MQNRRRCREAAAGDNGLDLPPHIGSTRQIARGSNLIAVLSLLACELLAPYLAAAEAPRADKYFKITVVDRQSGRGVPLVELRTVNNVRYFTDSNGIVAFNEPGLMGEEVFFFVSSHGYQFPADGFGNRGKALKAASGGSARLEIDRINIAERLYRITGADIYADSLLVGEQAPLAKPGLNGRVVGQDTAMSAVFCDKLYWFWGDTSKPSYPLGNFQTSGATSLLPGRGGLDPERGIELRYFIDEKGFARGMAPLPGAGPTWIDGVVTLKDELGRERMFAAYAKVRNKLEIYERGLVEFNTDRNQFEKVVTFPTDAPFHPGGQPFHAKVDGADYIYFATPFPLLRVKADVESLKRLGRYEGFSCVAEGSTTRERRLDRAPDGLLRYAWKKNTPPLNSDAERRAIAAGRMKPGGGLLQLQDVESGKPVTLAAGSVYWNDYRRRWIMIAVERGGTSMLGEIWYAEGDTPVGPWVYARKIVTHDRYDFYNPKQDVQFDKDGGRILFFEGTYVNTFSGNPNPTPRYDYNQIMYKLDLADERLALPVPVYRSADGEAKFSLLSDDKGPATGPIAFFATDRPAKSLAPIVEESAARNRRLRIEDSQPTTRSAAPSPADRVVFYALRDDESKPPPNTVPLYEFVSQDGKQFDYSTDRDWQKPQFHRADKPVCRVWMNPLPAIDWAAERNARAAK